MNIVVDTSVIIAVITNEAHKEKLVQIAKGTELIAASSLHWEIGNAFSAMFKRNRINLEQAMSALSAYRQIPIRYFDISLALALELSHELNIYAYDAYVIGCAIERHSPIISLDNSLLEASRKAGVKVVEVTL